jgi:anion-transporting  ArsA/GET3 family ATPase
MTASPLERQLLTITGKGGVGKTTVAAALGLLAAQRGRRTLIVEVGHQHRLGELFGLAPPGEAGVEMELQERLWSISIDPDRALLEWLQALGGRVSGRILASSGTFQYFAAAAPGAKELVSMVKIWELTRRERRRGRGGAYDLVVLDAPATGHALGMLHSPQTFGAIARVGPIHAQALRVDELLRDPARSSYLAVTHATEMAVSETLELQDDLLHQLGRSLDAVVVNSVLPRRFTSKELRQIDALKTPDTLQRSAAVAAHAVHERAGFQHSQLARLRRRDIEALGVPFVFSSELGLPAIQQIAEHLGRKL